VNPDSSNSAPGRPQPRSPADLFLSFTVLALQGFGGVLAVVQHELVERKRWLTRDEFIEEWAVAQVMPGPNVVNLALTLGARYFGWRGALAAVAGMLAVPLVIVVTLAVAYAQAASSAPVQGALRGMGAVAAGLIIASGLRLTPALARHALGSKRAWALALAAFVAVAWLRWPLAAVLFGLGSASCLLTWRRLAP
jgi:chromate transporter